MFYIPQLFSSFAHLEEIRAQNLNINMENISTLLTLTYHLNKIKKISMSNFPLMRHRGTKLQHLENKD